MTSAPTQQHLVFCGDSVTDCARKRAARYEDSDAALGNGWVRYVHRMLSAKHKVYFRVWNRGFSGCLTGEFTAQDQWWPKIDEQPVNAGLCTVMIGINDIWHPFWKARAHDIDQALAAYEVLLSQLSQQSESLLALEPIALPCGEVDHRWWAPLDDLSKGQEAIARKLGADWLPLQDALMKDAHGALVDYLYDGVHPSDLGHRWLSRQWLNHVSQTTLLEKS